MREDVAYREAHTSTKRRNNGKVTALNKLMLSLYLDPQTTLH